MKVSNKIKTREELSKICKKLREEGRKIGFTSGSFDILHAGHIAYLKEAKKRCDILIVGINSDKSVRKYKGKERPVIPEKERSFIVASLEPVDYVFLFDEIRNKTNIEKLRPDYYIKAGDYNESKLTSKEIVEKYGGKAVIIPIKFKTSSTEIINKIIQTFSSEPQKAKKAKKQRAVFLDRDGVINEDIEYLHEPEKLKILPNVMEGLKKIQGMGFRLVIVSNQPGIGFGYYKKEDFFKVNKALLKQLSSKCILIDKIYFCPHSKSENCKCRKPNTGLIKTAINDMNLDIKESYFVGDKTSDIETGRRAGCATILIKSKNPDNEYKIKPDYTANDLIDAANFILKRERSQ